MNAQASANATLTDFFAQLFGYREYLKQSVLRDLRTKYKRSSLGYLWTMLNPLAMMAVLAVVFSHIMRFPAKDYAVFLFAGLLPWNYFNSTVMMSLGNIRANARIFGQVPVPKYIFVVSRSASNLTNFVLAIIPMFAMMIFTNHPITWTALTFPIVVLPLICITISGSLVLSALNVFFDDTLHLAEVGMQVLYFLSPVMYSRDMLPPQLTQYLVLNPLFNQIEFIRCIFYQGSLPDMSAFALNLIVSILILFVSLVFFKKVEDKFLYFI